MDDVTEDTAMVENEAIQRDENRSPTSGSSSETVHDTPKGAEPAPRKHRRHSRSKRKRKWKPYSELSWDERKVQDDRETKRAFAKRERLSAEGHPIAPYNTTQFLMDDHKTNDKSAEGAPPNSKTCSPDPSNSPNVALVTAPQTSDDKCKPTTKVEAVCQPIVEPKPVSTEMVRKQANDSDDRDDIRRFILQDFSHTYAECHADELRNLSKPELVTECLKLEKKVESLERKVKDCQKRHKDGYRNQADKRLLDKITLLQAQNAQLLRDNAHLASRQEGASDEAMDS